jgi:hypothetical protein
MDFDIEEALKKLREFLSVFGLSTASEVTIYCRDSWTSEYYVKINLPKNRSFKHKDGGTIYFDDYGNKSITGFKSSVPKGDSGDC